MFSINCPDDALRPDLASTAATLLRADRRRRRLLSAVVVASALVVGPPALVGPTAGALRASAAAGAACVALLLALLVVHSDRHLAILDAIADGDEALPLPGVDVVRRQLLDPAHTARLVAGLRAHAGSSVAFRSLHAGVRLPWSLRTIELAAPELHELAAILAAARPARPCAVAACELLLTDGGRSPLHGGDDEALRSELARLAMMLTNETEVRRS